MSDLGTANCGCGCEGRDRFGGDCGCGVTADADAATTDVASAITAACGSSFFSVAAAVSATAVDAATTDVATTAACGSSFFSAAVVVSATDADAAMAVDADARQHNISCIGLKRRSHFSVSFFIYIYNADPGRSHYGRKTFKTNDTI